MIKTISRAPTAAEMIRKVNELTETVNNLCRVVEQHDQQIDMMLDLISQDAPTDKLDS